MKIVSKDSIAETEVKKSRFIGRLINVRSEKEAKLILEEVRKENRDANHNCYAMRIGNQKNVLERFSDDGEPQGTAGKPILELLKGNELYDVIGIVTRYFGGTLLGTGGLVRAYSDSLKEVLKSAPVHELKEGVKVSVICEYTLSNQIKYIAETMELFTESEEYTDKCTFYYLMPIEQYKEFADKIVQLSKGESRAVMEEKVLYYMENRPKVYAVLNENGGAV
ncbi:MAG: YigZ family protein [Eubacteriales bacterium]|nr:YigZ family protein [Eubacteriales bacterium]